MRILRSPGWVPLSGFDNMRDEEFLTEIQRTWGFFMLISTFLPSLNRLWPFRLIYSLKAHYFESDDQVDLSSQVTPDERRVSHCLSGGTKTMTQNRQLMF